MIYEIIFTILSGGILSLISFVLSYIKDKSDSKSIDKENKEIKEKIEIVKEFADEQTNVM